MSVGSYLSSRSPMMRVVWTASVPIWMVFMGTPSLSEGCTWGAEVEPRWRELEGATGWSPCPAVASWAAARAWSFSSAETPVVQSQRILITPLGAIIFKTRYP
jgi:hypothetical protein